MKTFGLRHVTLSRSRMALATGIAMSLAATTYLAPAAIGASGNGLSDPVAFYFPEYDKNGDDQLDRDEWMRRGNFDLLDADGNGGIDRKEFSVLYGSWGEGLFPLSPIGAPATPELDASVQTDAKDAESIEKKAICIVTRNKKCSDGGTLGEKFGLFPTGLGPIFPPQALCPGIDETYAQTYDGGHGTGKGGHGGIDIPVASGTPILAVADGTVVGLVDNEQQARGLAVILRHSPEDSGLPMWTFTEYAHLKTLPALMPGQRVKRGEVIAQTGNTGVKPGAISTNNNRRAGIHFAVYFSQSPAYAFVRDYIVPEKPNWMDPVAYYRLTGPYKSEALSELPEADKDVSIPVMMIDGTFLPANSKRIWPYACKPAPNK